MTGIDPNHRYQLAATHRLQWEEAQQSDVLLYPEGMVTLNASASEILKHLDGSHSVTEVIAALEQKFAASDLRDDVLQFMAAALERGWIKPC